MLKLKIGFVLQSYTGNPGPHERSDGPELIYKEAQKIFWQEGVEKAAKKIIRLTPQEEKEYGLWHRMGLANGHLSREVTPLVQKNIFVLGLLGNCNSLSGMLAGLQNSGDTKNPLSLGLVWMDAHADFNTPETTLSGWLGGMPVAVAAGKCLHRLRKKSGLQIPLSTQNIIMLGLRDVDPLEQKLIQDSSITTISSQEMLEDKKIFIESLSQLSKKVQTIYAHIDLDVLDASSIPGHNFEVSEGPSPAQLSEILRAVMRFDKVKALGIASFPTPEYGRKKSMDSTVQLISAAIQGLKQRKNS